MAKQGGWEVKQACKTGKQASKKQEASGGRRVGSHLNVCYDEVALGLPWGCCWGCARAALGLRWGCAALSRTAGQDIFFRQNKSLTCVAQFCGDCCGGCVDCAQRKRHRHTRTHAYTHRHAGTDTRQNTHTSSTHKHKQTRNSRTVSALTARGRCPRSQHTVRMIIPLAHAE